MDIGGHPPIPFGPAPSILAAFHFHQNLLFLAGCQFLNFRSHLEALMSHMDIGGHPPIPFGLAPSVLLVSTQITILSSFSGPEFPQLF